MRIEEISPESLAGAGYDDDAAAADDDDDDDDDADDRF